MQLIVFLTQMLAFHLFMVLKLAMPIFSVKRQEKKLHLGCSFAAFFGMGLAWLVYGGGFGKLPERVGTGLGAVARWFQAVCRCPFHIEMPVI